MTSLKKAFPVGQLPDKFKKVPTREPIVGIVNDDGMVFAAHERNVAALLRFSKTTAVPEQATPFERATIRAAMAAHGICPDCGGHVHVDTEAEVIVQGTDERETSRRQAPVAFCSSCECSIEMPAGE